MVGQDYVTEQLHVAGGRTLSYRQVEGSFSNPNGGVNTKCLNWLSEIADKIVEHRKSAVSAGSGSRSQEEVSGDSVRVASSGTDTDLLEMYCGNGNHTVCLAQHFSRCVLV